MILKINIILRSPFNVLHSVLVLFLKTDIRILFAVARVPVPVP